MSDRCVSARTPVPVPLPLLGAAAIALVMALCLASGCTIEDVHDELRVIERVPAPSGAAPAPHRLSRELTLGQDTDRVEQGNVTSVDITVLSPEGADLFPFLRIDLFVETGGQRSQLAQAADFTQGEQSRSLEVLFTGDIKPLLQASDFTILWEVYYRTGATYPGGGIELETVIGFNVDIEII